MTRRPSLRFVLAGVLLVATASVLPLVLPLMSTPAHSDAGFHAATALDRIEHAPLSQVRDLPATEASDGAALTAIAPRPVARDDRDPDATAPAVAVDSNRRL